MSRLRERRGILRSSLIDLDTLRLLLETGAVQFENESKLLPLAVDLLEFYTKPEKVQEVERLRKRKDTKASAAGEAEPELAAAHGYELMRNSIRAEDKRRTFNERFKQEQEEKKKLKKKRKKERAIENKKRY